MSIQQKERIRSICVILFLIYMAGLLYFLLFADSYGRNDIMGEYRYNLVLFREIRRYLQYPDILGLRAVLTNLLGNVIGFMPFGMLLPILLRRRKCLMQVLLSALGMSLCVELLQLCFRVGCFDVDDILLNTGGVFLGYMVLDCTVLHLKHHEESRQ